MKTILSALFLFGLTFFIMSCKQQTTLTEIDKGQIADSAKFVVKQIFDLSNKLEFNAALKLYCQDNDAHYSENGTVYPSFEALRTKYEQAGPTVELLENKIDKWNILVLAKDAVVMTLPVHFKIKIKGLAAYNGQYVWSGVVQKRNGKWMLVQSHESWLNFEEVLAAMTPPTSEMKQ